MIMITGAPKSWYFPEKPSSHLAASIASTAEAFTTIASRPSALRTDRKRRFHSLFMIAPYTPSIEKPGNGAGDNDCRGHNLMSKEYHSQRAENGNATSHHSRAVIVSYEILPLTISAAPRRKRHKRQRRCRIVMTAWPVKRPGPR